MSILDSFSLHDKVVVVTGASSGLGVAFARAVAEAGADVVLAARREEQMRQTAVYVEATGRKAHCAVTDVAQPDQCLALVESAISTFGRVDVLINNAGIGTAVPALKETAESFRTVIDVNLNGAFWMAQACARVMSPGSSIVNIASALGLTTASMPQASYSASKAGLMGLTRDLAQEWGTRRGIRVNAVAPGFFRSEMTAELPPGYFEAQSHRSLLGRHGEPDELAAAVVWLASAAGGYVTGQTIVVDGGLTIA